MLPIRRGDVWMSHLSGTWAAEGQLSHEKLQLGEFVIRNNDGTRNSHTDHAEVMFSLDGKGQENAGNVIGAALVYSGNYKLKRLPMIPNIIISLPVLTNRTLNIILRKVRLSKLLHSL